jgi:hypothetical protein
LHRKTDTQVQADADRLVNIAIDGDTDAFGRLYDMHIDRVYRHVYYKAGNVCLFYFRTGNYN